MSEMMTAPDERSAEKRRRLFARHDRVELLMNCLTMESTLRCRVKAGGSGQVIAARLETDSVALGGGSAIETSKTVHVSIRSRPCDSKLSVAHAATSKRSRTAETPVVKGLSAQLGQRLHVLLRHNSRNTAFLTRLTG